MKRKNPPASEFWKSAGVCLGAAAVSATMLTGCTWFQPKDNVPATVYGPPEAMETPYNPADDEPEDVYGPPPEETYNPGDDEMAPVYGPPPDEDWDPWDDNDGEWVYGPPDDWDSDAGDDW
jgi:hypothetical protein